MGWAPKRHDVRIPAQLAKLAGFAVATCRYLGPRQQGAIALALHQRQRDSRGAAGEAWAEKMVGRVTPEMEREQRERNERLKRDDPVAWALEQWPVDMVCEQAVKAFDGDAVDAGEWLEDAPHPSVARHIAVEVLRASELIPETESERGNGSGGSPASS